MVASVAGTSVVLVDSDVVLGSEIIESSAVGGVGDVQAASRMDASAR
jgi:hypothetical protein